MKENVPPEIDSWISYYDLGYVSALSLWERDRVCEKSDARKYDARIVFETEDFAPNLEISLIFRNVRQIILRNLPGWIDTEAVCLIDVNKEGQRLRAENAISADEWARVSQGMNYCYGESFTDPATNIYFLCEDVEWEYIQNVGVRP